MNTLDLITKDTADIIGLDELKNMINTGKQIKVYWGTATTGRIHIGYFVPLLKIADLINAGCDVTILLADLHAYLDNMKSTIDQIEYRSEYYKEAIKNMLSRLNVDGNKIKFVKGSTYQLSKDYTIDMYRANSIVSLRNAKHAGAEVVKQTDNPIMNGLLYPTLQALDEQYLNVDAQLGGLDQRKIMMHARWILPKLGYKKRIEIMTNMVSGLRMEKKNNDTDNDIDNDTDNDIDNKMSASDELSKIDILDSKNNIKKKINKAYCLVGDIEDNSILDILGSVIFPVLDRLGRPFIINRKEKFGGPITYKSFDDIQYDFENKKLHPADLKLGMISEINNILAPIRDNVNYDIVKRAYKS